MILNLEKPKQTILSSVGAGGLVTTQGKRVKVVGWGGAGVGICTSSVNY